MTRAAYVLLSLLWLASACRRPAPEQPNLVLITIDTLRADALGCYGSPIAASPNIDRLASEGVRVTHAYAVAPITAPSHASLLTGRYPLRHGVRTNGLYRLAESETSLAELLSDAGYATAAFVSGVPLDHRFGFAQGFATFDDDFSKSVLRGQDLSPWYRIPLAERERRADESIGPALAWLERHDRQKPFFLWVHLFDPHSPYAPPAPFDHAFDGAGDVSRAVDHKLVELINEGRSWHRWLQGKDSIENVKRLYRGEVGFTDAQVGRLLDAIDGHGHHEDTVVVLVSDHGESLDEHETYFFHGDDLFEPSLRVPLIVRAPWRLGAGTTARVRARGVDVMPTVLELLSRPPASDLDGESLLSALIDGREEQRPVFSEAPFRDASGRGLRAYLEGDLKLIQRDAREGGEAWTGCFDVRADPRESRDLCRSRRDDFAPLGERLDGLVQRLERPDPGAYQIAPEVMEALESLGYTSE